MKKFFYLFYLLCSSYLITELIFSYLIISGHLQTQQQEICMVDTSEPLIFNPVSGYSISQAQTGFAQFSENQIMFASEFKGNNHGFYDSCDFTLERTDASEIRIGVFGDSFTAAPYLMTNFTERCEELSLKSRKKLNLMNFALDGCGLATWWSIITLLFREYDFELDMLVFAVYGDDLERSFHFRDSYSGYTWVGYDPILYDLPWNIDSWPKNRREARNKMYRDAMLVSQERFDRAVHEKRFLPARPYLAKFIRTTLQYSRLVIEFTGARPELNSNLQLKMWDDIAQYAQQKNIPILVIRVPDESTLTSPSEPIDIIRFAEHISADYRDGVIAYPPNLNAYGKYFLFNDNHWNQIGSDFFAHYLFNELNIYFDNF